MVDDVLLSEPETFGDGVVDDGAVGGVVGGVERFRLWSW